MPAFLALVLPMALALLAAQATAIIPPVAMAAAEVPPPMYTPPAPNEQAVAQLVQPERMLADVRQLVAAGNRFGGSRSNQTSALYAASQLLALGFDVQLVNDAPATWTYDQGRFVLELVSPSPAAAWAKLQQLNPTLAKALLPLTSNQQLTFVAAYPYSFSTTPDQPVVDLEAPVVYVGTGDKPEAYKNADAAGKIVLMDGSPRRNAKLAKQAGAVAILTDYPNNADMYQDSAMLSSLPPTDPNNLPVMAISYTEGQALKVLLGVGATSGGQATPQASSSPAPQAEIRLHFHVEQRIYQAEPITVIARLQPTQPLSASPSAPTSTPVQASAPASAQAQALAAVQAQTPAPAQAQAQAPASASTKFILITAHADGDSGGPSADDNASGIAAVLELARTLRTAVQQGLWQPTFAVEFTIFGKEYHSAGAWLKRNADRLPNLLGVINYDEVGTGASRDAIFFESPDVPYNELLLRTFDSVGRDYAGQPGFWKEYATDDSLGGTDSYAFLANWTARGNGRYDGPYLIPATTVFTAAWNEADVIPQVPFWPNKGLAAGDPVVVDYSAYYHSSRDLPETTTDKEPFNLVNAVRSTALTLLRLNHLYSQPTPFADDAEARFDPNRLYAEALYRSGIWQPAQQVADGTITASAPVPSSQPPATAGSSIRPLAALAQVPTLAEIEQVAQRMVQQGRQTQGSLTPGANSEGGPIPTDEQRKGSAEASSSLTRLGFARLLAQYTGLALPNATTTAEVLKTVNLADAEQIAPSDQPVVALALQQGWLLPNYNTDGEPVFAPDAPLSRGEALKRLSWALGQTLVAGKDQ